jgi:hypothetical protein
MSQFKDHIRKSLPRASEYTPIWGDTFSEFAPVYSKAEVDNRIEKAAASTKSELQDALLLIRKLTHLVPEAWEVTQYKSTERPPELLFKVRNRLTGQTGEGPTEEDAKHAATPIVELTGDDLSELTSYLARHGHGPPRLAG